MRALSWLAVLIGSLMVAVAAKGIQVVWCSPGEMTGFGATTFSALFSFGLAIAAAAGCNLRYVASAVKQAPAQRYTGRFDRRSVARGLAAE